MYMGFFFFFFGLYWLQFIKFLNKKACEITSKILYNQIDGDCWILAGDDKITSKYIVMAILFVLTPITFFNKNKMPT